MKTVQILEGKDIVQPTDWCRPLDLINIDDEYSFTSCYSGKPENNTRWIQVQDVFGKMWWNKTVSELDDTVGQYQSYEFVRGDIPNRNRVFVKD